MSNFGVWPREQNGARLSSSRHVGAAWPMPQLMEVFPSEAQVWMQKDNALICDITKGVCVCPLRCRCNVVTFVTCAAPSTDFSAMSDVEPLYTIPNGCSMEILRRAC